MPGRSSIMLILAFFLTMATFQYMRNYGGRMDEAPALKPALELAAEDGATEWTLYANGKKLGRAYSQVIKSQSGVYTLKQVIDLNGDLEDYVGPLSFAAKSFGINLNDYQAFLRTDMELTYLGSMRTFHIGFGARPRPKIVLPEDEPKLSPEAELAKKEDKSSLISFRLDGKVVSEQLTFKGLLTISEMKFPIDDYKIRYRGKDSYLSNIAPTDCMVGLRPGQRWQTPVIDPASMMFNAFASSKSKDFNFDPEQILGGKKLTEAFVLEEPRDLEWHGTKVPCFVVQTADKGSRMQVWVNKKTSRVLRQVLEWQNGTKSIELVRQLKKED